MATNEELVLDGNAVGGLLAEAFGEDVTARMGTCPACGNHAALATARAYTHAPGVVLRCMKCDVIQAVVVRTPRGIRAQVTLKLEGPGPR